MPSLNHLLHSNKQTPLWLEMFNSSLKQRQKLLPVLLLQVKQEKLMKYLMRGLRIRSQIVLAVTPLQVYKK